MLHAAKRHEPIDAKMAIGFVRHALDEYKHTEYFRTIINLLNDNDPTINSSTRFIPTLAISKGYIDPDKLLFDKMNLKRFSVFIGVNEESAHKLFSKLKLRFEETNTIELSKDNISLIKTTLSSILEDEKRHSNMAFEYSKKSIRPVILSYYKFLESVTLRIRSLYASQGKINKWIATAIYSIVITFIYPLRFAIYLPIKNNNNLFDKNRAKLMI